MMTVTTKIPSYLRTIFLKMLSLFLLVCVHTYMCGHIRHDAHVEVRRLGLVVFFPSTVRVLRLNLSCEDR